MDAYSFSLALGAVGLGAMAVSGLGHHLHPGHAIGHAHSHGAGGRVGGRAGRGHAGQGAHHGVGRASRAFLTLLSPRVLFSLLVGFGATGMALRGVLPGPFVAVAGLGGAGVFEFLLARPLWNFSSRFASTPALPLESCIGDAVAAVSRFDASGSGLVSLELDGRMVQLLGTLVAAERMAGDPVHAGEQLYVVDVDGERQRVTVSRQRS